MNKVLLVAAALLATLLTTAAPASATSGFAALDRFATVPTDGMPHQRRIAVDETTGHIYVTDVVNDQITVYQPAGNGANPLTSFGTGELTDPFGIAIDQSTGDVYVSDEDDIIKYTSDGAPTPTFTKDTAFAIPGVTGPLAFDQANSRLLVADKAAGLIRRYTTSGASLATFDGSAGAGSPGVFTGLQDLAVDSTGDVLVVDSTGDPVREIGTTRVSRYSVAGNFEDIIGDVEQAGTVAVRPADDDVIISGGQDSAWHNGKSPTAQGFTSDGRSTVSLAVASDLVSSTVSGMASAAGPNGRFYIATAPNDYFGNYVGRTSIQAYDGFAIVAPTISDISTDVSEADVRVKAKIATSGAPTTYRVEFGTTTAYGQSLPAAGPVELPGATVPTAVAQMALSLAPSTTYHYRLTATNVSGTVVSADRTVTTKSGEVGHGNPDSCPNAAIRAQQQAAELPDCRAFEQVSPVDKNGSPVFYLPDSSNALGATFAARDGSAAVFSAVTPFANSTHGIYQSQRAQRGPDGWATTVVSPPTTQRSPNVFSNPSGMWLAASPDTTKGVAFTNNEWSPGDRNSDADIYLLDAEGHATLASAGPDGTAAGGAIQVNSAVTDDGTVLFATPTALVPEDSTPGVLDLYEHRNGTVRLVGVGPDGHATECGSSLTGGYGATPDPEVGPATRMTPDAGHVVFQSPGNDNDAGCPYLRHLYVRIDGTRTLDVSKSRRTVADPNGPRAATFVGMSVDGVRIFFSSAERLTDDAPDEGDLLYEYRSDTDHLRYLGLGNDARTVAISHDGERLYFVSGSLLAPGGVADRSNLYVLENGQVAWIAASGDNEGGWYSEIRTSAVSVDGRSLLFSTTAHLGADNTNDKMQAYLYREGEGVRCVSCPPSSVTPTSNVRITNGSGYGGGNARGVYASSLTDDGSRVLFDTADALSPVDGNNRRDVYEWHEGTVRLISGAQPGNASYVLGLSGDGHDAFFGSSASLAPSDVDAGDLDIYDARIDGGFLAESDGKADRCTGDDCQGPQVAVPGRITPGSADGSNSDAPDAVVRPGAASTKLTVTKPKKITGVSATLRVKVGQKGRISASGSGVTSVTRSVPKAGAYGVRVALSSAARRALARSHRKAVRVTVRFVPQKGRERSVSVRLTFTSPARRATARRATVPSISAAR